MALLRPLPTPTNDLLPSLMVELCLVLAPDVNFFLNSRKQWLPCWRSLSFLLSFLFFPFCQSFSMEPPYILHASPSQTVFDILSQRHNKTCHFSSDIMDYFLAGKDRQQTNQPDDVVRSTWHACAGSY